MEICFQVVASGIFLKDGPGLKDPCEKEELDVTANLSLQQKEDLTQSAQRYLRFMHFRQIYRVLGMSREEYYDEGVTKDQIEPEPTSDQNGKEAEANV